MTEEGRSGENEANRSLENELANELINFANDKLAAGVNIGGNSSYDVGVKSRQLGVI
jgi:hypothetical protein